jgi:crossover junction endodeoxyribonuclease RuvC
MKTASKTPTTILGIDPGTNVMGYGVISFVGAKVALVEMGVLKLAKYKDPYKRLMIIYHKVQELNRVFKPAHFAIEAPFYAKNVQSMLKLGRAQGVAIAAAAEAGLEITEYMPKRIKQSVTGNGNATKEQVWRMLQQTLNLEERPEFLDATDALAAAMTMYYELRGLGVASKVKGGGWDDFLKNNPARIKK